MMQSTDCDKWEERFKRERLARKESETLLEAKSMELWKINQSLEQEVQERTKSLQKALIEAENASKVKSTFLANMSHEIRTPLNAIIGFSQVLSNSDRLCEADSKKASLIENSAKSLLNIINDILDISKIESGNFDINPVESDLYKTCENVIELFLVRASKKDIKLRYEIDESIPRCMLVDDIRLQQVISNLINNAIKFTPEMGSVFLKVSLEDVKDDHASIVFEVEDNGIGIPKDRLNNIFDPFVQVDHASNRKYEGTGLGLSICSHLVDGMGGKIDVDSEIGSGTKFSFTLELKICETQKSYLKDDENPKKSSLVKLKSGKNLSNEQVRILVAEDNLSNQELIKYYLNELNIDHVIVSNGEEAYNACKKDRFDLVLMDINMPLLDGIEAMKKIKEHEEIKQLSHIPIIALTANAIKGDKERFLSLGMSNYISKPIEYDELKRVLGLYIYFDEGDSKDYASEQSSIQGSISLDAAKIEAKLNIPQKLANMFIDRFKKEIGSDMQKLKEVIEEKDQEKIKQRAHYIKNNCLNVVFDEAVELLEKIEDIQIPILEKESLYEQLCEVVNPLKVD